MATWDPQDAICDAAEKSPEALEPQSVGSSCGAFCSTEFSTVAKRGP